MIFQVIAVLVILKAVMTVMLALRHHTLQRVRARQRYPLNPLGVTVLIAAYNEEVGIAATLDSVLSQDVAVMQVIVVDDGSTDRTAEIVTRYAQAHPNVTLLRQTNAGKAAALNRAIPHARHPVTVSVDADSALAPGTLLRLAHHFHDLNVGAVAGDVRIAGPRTALCSFQLLEYTIGQHLEKRAQDTLGLITVVPGAAGAYRTALLRELGGYSHQTLTEDMDLTVAVALAGYQVHFEPRAISFTEPPLTVRSLWRQRLRWMHGTFQVMGKYRHLLFRPSAGRVGVLALPYILLYGLTLGGAGPLFDLMILAKLLQHASGHLWLPLLLNVGADFLITATALSFARGAWSALWWTPAQRLLLRPFVSVVVVITCLNLVRRRHIHWNKLPRVGLNLGALTRPEQAT